MTDERQQTIDRIRDNRQDKRNKTTEDMQQQARREHEATVTIGSKTTWVATGKTAAVTGKTTAATSENL